MQNKALGLELKECFRNVDLTTVVAMVSENCIAHSEETVKSGIELCPNIQRRKSRTPDVSYSAS